MKAGKAVQAAAIGLTIGFGFFLHPPRLTGVKAGALLRTPEEQASVPIPSFVRWGSKVESDKTQIQTKVGSKLKVLLYLESIPIL